MRQLLKIETVPIKLDYNITKGQYNMRSPKATCDVSIERPQLQVQSSPIKVKIDRRAMYASMGVYMPDDFRRKTESDSRQIVLDIIGQIGDDGKAMAETQGGAFVDICRRKCGFDKTVELETAFIPSVRPDITWEGGEKSDVSFTPFKMDIKWNVHVTPEIEYNRGKVDISVSQWHKVNIAYTGTADDVLVVGKKLNFKI